MKFFNLDDATPFLLYLDLGESRSVRRMLALARRAGAETVVLTEGVARDASSEWCNEWDVFYGPIGLGLAATCSRLDFVRGQVRTKSELETLLANCLAAHVGFALLRPPPLNSVVLGVVPPAPGNAVQYIGCCCRYPARLGDIGVATDHHIAACPTMEQDGTVSVCAHASLWIATDILSKRFPDCQPVTSGFACEAIRRVDPTYRAVPSPGLAIYQLWAALDAAGYTVMFYDVEGFKEGAEESLAPDHLVYRYVESGIPAIAVLDLEIGAHTIAIVGHTFDPDAWWAGARAGYYPSLYRGKQWIPSALWTPQYIVQDDNYGPYLDMSRGSLRNRSTAVIVPVPASVKMMMPPEEAETTAAAVLYAPDVMLAYMHPDNKSEWTAHIYARHDDGRFVLRTLLLSKGEMTSHIQATNYAEETRGALLALQVPDWLWMVEVSAANMFGEMLKLGEVLLDPRVPTALRFQGMNPLLALHLPGFVLHRTAEAQYQHAYTGPELPTRVFTRGPTGGA
jgi:hypothetical protein